MYIVLKKNEDDREVFALENFKYSADQYSTSLFEIITWDIEISGASPIITGFGNLLVGEIEANKIVCDDHKIRNNKIVKFVQNKTGIIAGAGYYVVNSTSNNFQISDTEGGAAKEISGEGIIQFQEQPEKYVEARNYGSRRETDFKHSSDYLHNVYKCVLDLDGVADTEKTAWEDEIKAIKDKHLKPWTNCTIDIGTDVITSVAHKFSNDEFVEFQASELPGGISVDTKYYVIEKTTDTFKISATLSGSPIDITSAGTSVQWRKRYIV